jgi:hypothetical protein
MLEQSSCFKEFCRWWEPPHLCEGRSAAALRATVSTRSCALAVARQVPADDKVNARLIVSRIVLGALEDLKMAYPKTTAKRRQELQAIRKLLAK